MKMESGEQNGEKETSGAEIGGGEKRKGDTRNGRWR
jgi:hypothetical protein